MIRKLLFEEGKLKVTLDLELDARPFRSLHHAREFIVDNTEKIQNLINRFAFARCSITIKELAKGEKPAIRNSLSRLGFLDTENE